MVAVAIPQSTKGHAFGAGAFLLGVVCTALVGVPTGLYVAKQANTALLKQQTTLTQLQAFEATGGQLDNAVRRVSDGLGKPEGPSTSDLDNLRDAIGAHSSATFALREKVGGDYPAYMAKLRELRVNADKAQTPKDGVAMWQSAVDAIGLRRRVSDRITAEATER